MKLVITKSRLAFLSTSTEQSANSESFEDAIIHKTLQFVRNEISNGRDPRWNEVKYISYSQFESKLCGFITF